VYDNASASPALFDLANQDLQSPKEQQTPQIKAKNNDSSGLIVGNHSYSNSSSG
jgi:hypothetical protein